MVSVILIAYFALLLGLSLFGLHRLSLALIAQRARPLVLPPPPAEWPKVVVQLPLYNEAFVAERLLRSVLELDYPRAKLEIQVLDDSTDETRAIVRRIVDECGRPEVALVTRLDRSGYKAGALQHGLRFTDAEVVAIFDADFVPPPDFLRKTVPFLMADAGVGMVQARWSHLNRDTSLLTRAQALYLDAHFGVEHLARATADLCFNFNGTAGIWRREAIESAGGWKDDTITEDLDLSYRAQFLGWRFVYLDDVLVPSELPEDLTAFRAQQARWVRGGIQTAKIHLPRVLGHRAWRPRRRIEALVHLSTNLAYLMMSLVALLLPASVLVRSSFYLQYPSARFAFAALDAFMFGAGLLALIAFYWTAIKRAPTGTPRARFLDLPAALALGAGMSLSNGLQVLKGLFGQRAEFVRTPKRGEVALTRVRRLYRPSPGFALGVVEFAFALYFGITILLAGAAGSFGAIPFLGLYFAGFAWVAGSAFRSASENLRWPRLFRPAAWLDSARDSTD